MLRLPCEMGPGKGAAAGLTRGQGIGPGVWAGSQWQTKCLETFLVDATLCMCIVRREGSRGKMQLVSTKRVVANNSTMHRTVPHIKELGSSKCLDVENPCAIVMRNWGEVAK